MPLHVLFAGVVLLAASGCAQLNALLTPTPTPPSQRPALPEKREPPSPPILSPQMDTDQEERLIEEAHKRIEVAEQNLQAIDARKLAADQQETYQTITSFLNEARAALNLKDVPRALNLAQKAHILSDELSKAVR